jgi:general secretion pathway protein B
MSYILEALRRAETERERRRRVPGLHTQPVPVSSTDEPGARRSKALWWMVVVGLGAGVLLMSLWQWWSGEPAREEPLATRAAVAGNVTPQASTGATDDARPGDVAAAAATGSASLPAATAQQPPSPHQPTHPVPKAAAADSKGGTGTRHERAPAAAAHTEAANHPTSNRATAQATAPPIASAPEARLRTLAELPNELRRDVPPLNFGGSVYSETAAQRMVIFNGQVFREGDSVTDELVMEQIRPHSAVLRLRGQRFEVTF